MALSYFLIIVVALILLNIYPVSISQDFIFQSKQASMEARLSMLTTSLSALETLTTSNVQRAAELLDDGGLSRILVADRAGKVLYDNSEMDNAQDKLALQREVVSALRGNDIFFCQYRDAAFHSRGAAPVMIHGQVGGVVYLYEFDAEQAALLKGIQSNMFNISVGICLAVVVLSLFFSTWFSRRISALLRAMREFHAGKYQQRALVRGHDELAELAQQFNDMTDRLERTEEVRRQFISDASHELKTPLASIRLLTDSILQTEDMDPGTMREFIGDVGDEIDRLTRMTEKLLMLTKSDAEVAAYSGRVDLKSVTLRAAHLLDPLATREGVDIRCELADECFIHANEDDIYQVVFNLMENAMKYNRPSGTVSAFLFEKNRVVTLIIEDTGYGIPAGDLPHVFERFYRVDKDRSREKGGSGLGLSIVKANVEHYGGKIAVESHVDQGTRFVVTFPLYL